ncbi:MAG: UDP-N-acetylglucosamine 2-epimerase (non-hydrolyzing) [candidate division Zixibacteria bacterium]|nr:UDP-N-acetylglucosamine 2-epimerase (non-hydrolyzing) [candidate division Zixibacteria bacterium]
MPKRKYTIISLVGARPQFVKLAPLAKRLSRSFQHIIIHSGQHYDNRMSDVFFKQLKIPSPDKNLNIGSGSHGAQTGKMLELFERELVKVRPDMVLVYGDTNTTMAGALAAVKLHIPIGHIEAGLRSFNDTMPEEINRKVTDHVSSLLYYPTPAARKNLKAEGLSRGLIRSGDLMYEILDACTNLPYFKKNHQRKFGVSSGDYCLVTLHRAENADNKERLSSFVSILQSLPYQTIFLAHPRTVKNLKKFGLYSQLKKSPSVIISQPVPYLETLSLLNGAKALLTDSGGMQKEAYFLGIPCLTLRPETEWVETVASGDNTLTDMSRTKVLRVLKQISWRKRKKLNYKINGRMPSDVISKSISKFLQKKS